MVHGIDLLQIRFKYLITHTCLWFNGLLSRDPLLCELLRENMVGDTQYTCWFS